MFVRAATLIVALLACCAGPLAAAAQAKPASSLWATVNVCDTATRPDTLGIRASMPGTAEGRELMFMRFRAQYLSVEDGKWHNIVAGGDSGYVEVGRANKARQKGRNFPIVPKLASVVLRGVVNFQWRMQGSVVRRAERVTHKGHKSATGADPAGFSSAFCTVTL